MTANNTIVFIMGDKLTRASVQNKIKANYLFLELDHSNKGVRLYLTIKGEEQDENTISMLLRRSPVNDGNDSVRFRPIISVNIALTLIRGGGEEIELQSLT